MTDSAPLGLIHRRSGNPERAEHLGPYLIEPLIDAAEEGRATVYRVAIPAGSQTAISYHRLAEEFYFVLAGRGTAVLDGRNYPLETGDFCGCARHHPRVHHRPGAAGDARRPPDAGLPAGARYLLRPGTSVSIAVTTGEIRVIRGPMADKAPIPLLESHRETIYLEKKGTVPIL